MSVESNLFEIERRIVGFKSTTSLPGGGTLAWNADPNSVTNNNTAGETLLYNCPMASQYTQDDGTAWRKSIVPNIWVEIGSGGGGGTSSDGYSRVFINSELISGILTVTHGLSSSSDIVHVSVMDNNNNLIVPDNIEFISGNQCEIDLSAFVPIDSNWCLNVGFGGTGTGGGIVDPLQVDGDTVTPLTGSFNWDGAVISGLNDPHNIAINNKVSLSYTVPSQIWVNCELTTNGSDDYILIPIDGNSVEYIVTGQQFIVTGGVTDGNVYALSNTISLNGTLIPDYHLSNITLVTGANITLPLYPLIDTPTSIDRVGGEQILYIDSQVLGISPTTITIDKNTTFSKNIENIDIYSTHYIRNGNLGINKIDPKYPLDVNGTVNVDKLISNRNLSKFDIDENSISLNENELVFFGTGPEKQLTLSSEYYQYYDENSDGVSDEIVTGNANMTITPYGLDCFVTMVSGGTNYHLESYSIDSDGLKLGTIYDIGESFATTTLLFPLKATHQTIKTSELDKYIGLIRIDGNTDTYHTGYYEVSPETGFNITPKIAFRDSGHAVPATHRLRQVISIKTDVDNEHVRYYALLVQNGTSEYYIQMVKIDMDTLNETFGVMSLISDRVEYTNSEVFGHYRENSGDINIFFNIKGNFEIKSASCDNDNMDIGPFNIDRNIPMDGGHLLYVECFDTYIGTNSFDFKAIIHSTGSYTILESSYKSGSRKIVAYIINNIDARVHGSHTFVIRQMGLSSKVVAFGHHTDRNVVVIDLNTKTIKSSDLGGTWDYIDVASARMRMVALSDRISYLEYGDSFKTIKFFDNGIGILEEVKENVAYVMMQGTYNSILHGFDIGDDIYLGSIMGVQKTTLGFSKNTSCGVKLGEIIANNKLYFNPQLNTNSGFTIPEESAPTTINALNVTEIITSEYTASSWDNVRCNTASGGEGGSPFTVNLPASPTDGDIIAISDINNSFNNYPVTLDAGSIDIENNGSTKELNVDNIYIQLIYCSEKNNWLIEDNYPFQIDIIEDGENDGELLSWSESGQKYVNINSNNARWNSDINIIESKISAKGISNKILPLESNDWCDIAHGGGVTVMVKYTDTNHFAYSHDSGETWNYQLPPNDPADNNGWVRVCYGNGVFVAVAHTGGINNLERVCTSPDGVNWTLRTMPEVAQLRGIAYGDGVFIAVAESGTNRIFRSVDDGVTWTALAIATVNEWYDITYENNIFMVHGKSTGAGFPIIKSIYYSSGTVWTSSSTGMTTIEPRSIASGNGVTIIAGLTGPLIRSVDYLTTSDIIIGTGNTLWQDVIFAEGMFFIFSSNSSGNNFGYSSDNGLTWTYKRISGYRFKKACYVNGKILATTVQSSLVIFDVSRDNQKIKDSLVPLKQTYVHVNSGTSGYLADTLKVISWGIPNIDELSEMSENYFTAKHSGTYSFSFNFVTETKSWVINDGFDLSVYINDTLFQEIDSQIITSNVSKKIYINGSINIKMKQGDVFKLMGYSHDTISFTDTVRTFLTIARI